MKTFTDAAGRTWSISLTLGSAMAVKDRLKVDLLQPEVGYPPLLTRLGTDEILLGEVLCALLEDQFENHNVTAADVRRAFDGKTLLAAQTAFYEELIDFFRSRGRADRATAAAKQQAIIRKATEAVGMRIEQMDVDAMVDEAIPRTSGKTSGTSPEPSESTPAL